MKFLLLLIPFLTFSQEQTAKGFVLDTETKIPIPYVNISIIKSKIGTSSDDDGSYILTIKDEDLSKSIKLSSLGYKDSTIVVSKFLNLDKVFLQPIAEELEEVVISEKFEEHFFEINPIRKKDIIGGFGGFKDHPYIFALYFPYQKTFNNTEYISIVKVFLNKKSFAHKLMPSKFRLRLFSIGIDSLPDRDLLSKSLIIETSKKQRDVEIDLSEFNITFPEEGVFVALEWLHIPFNAYEFTYTKGKSKKKYTEIRYAPRLSWIKQKNSENYLVIYAIGRWIKQKIPYTSKDDFMIPAIFLTLSN